MIPVQCFTQWSKNGNCKPVDGGYTDVAAEYTIIWPKYVVSVPRIGESIEGKVADQHNTWTNIYTIVDVVYSTLDGLPIVMLELKSKS